MFAQLPFLIPRKASSSSIVASLHKNWRPLYKVCCKTGVTCGERSRIHIGDRAQSQHTQWQRESMTGRKKDGKRVSKENTEWLNPINISRNRQPNRERESKVEKYTSKVRKDRKNKMQHRHYPTSVVWPQTQNTKSWISNQRPHL